MTQESLISPTDLRDFTKSLGWELVKEGLSDRLYVLQNPKFPNRQLTFPMDLAAPDYAESTQRVIDKLSEILDVHPGTLQTRALNIREDSLRFRIFSEQNGDRSLPLSFTTSLVSGLQQLLKASACNVMRPKAYHPRLAFTEAQQLIEKSRFGHTAPGSFVLQVSCPIHALDIQGALPMGDESDLPFVRRVTLALKRGMEQLIFAIEGDSLDQFVDSLKSTSTPILSSNLCEALTQFYDETLGNSLDISFDWSALEPISAKDSMNGTLRFQRDYFGRIEEIRRELRPKEGHSIDTFIGTVERLSGEMGEDGHRSGEVILNLLLQEGESVRTRVSLDSQQYQEADKAHMTEGAYIRVCGKLLPGRQPRQMTELSSFGLIRS
ncbi:MAG: hypothetical protein KGZ69_00590 [Methylomonas sp.]|nr:hypothetical protein [Methylomonas sp.]